MLLAQLNIKHTHIHTKAVNEMLTMRNKLAFLPTSKDIPLIGKSTNEDFLASTFFSVTWSLDVFKL